MGLLDPRHVHLTASLSLTHLSPNQYDTHIFLFFFFTTGVSILFSSPQMQCSVIMPDAVISIPVTKAPVFYLWMFSCSIERAAGWGVLPWLLSRAILWQEKGETLSIYLYWLFHPKRSHSSLHLCSPWSKWEMVPIIQGLSGILREGRARGLAVTGGWLSAIVAYIVICVRLLEWIADCIIQHY